MNKFDELYEIRLANVEDIPMIMEFIDAHWKKGHIMAVDRELFEYEYVYGNEVNFILAIDKIKLTLEGILSFLYASNPTNNTNRDIWGSIWKVKKGNIPFLGIEIAKRLEKITGCRMELGCGVNLKTAAPLRKKIFKDNISKMEHYYILNPEIENYAVANISNKIIKKYNENDLIDIKIFKNNDILKENFNEKILELNKPYKDLWYVKKRFYKHPYYVYTVYGLKLKEDVKYTALFVTREISVNGKKILRIVDYLGDRSLFRYAGSFLESIIKTHMYEYIDFYNIGFESQYLTEAGFVLKDETDINIIPNYFEPFVQSNVDIWVNYPGKYADDILFFKADADQDRPNIIK